MAKLKTFFYTDLNRLDAQLPAQAFGPDSVTPDTKYNVGSRHSYSGSAGSGPNAYAVLNGTIVARKVPGSSPALVNLILKPSIQPAVEGIPTIKYIVYRGILASSLFNTSGGQDFMLLDSDPNANDLTRKMQSSHADRDQTPPVPADALFVNGTPVALPDGTTETAQEAKLFRAFNAGNVFDPELDGLNQPTDVDAGNYIGRFHPADFGVEFIQDTVGFDPDIQYVELTKKIIDKSTDSPEDILPFIDPCGFYGSFTEGQVYVRSNSGDSNSTPTEPVKYIGALDIYDNILHPFFVNCNTVFVEIRNQFNFSYDYFNEYSGSVSSNPTANLKFSTNTAEIQTSYDAITYNDFNGIHWPIMLVKPSNFSSGSNANPKSTLCLSFSKGSDLIPDENENPVIYVAQGKLKSKFKKKTGRSVLGEFGDGIINDTDFTKPIKIELLNAGGSAGPISCYIRIKYSKQYSICPTPISNGSILRSIEILDNIFCPFDMQVKNPVSTTHIQMRVFEEEIHVDALGFTGQSHFSHQGIVRDATGTVTFFVVARQKVVKDQGSVYQPIPLIDISLQTQATFPEYIQQQNDDMVMVASDIIVGPGGPATPTVIPGILTSQRAGDADTYKDYNPNDLLWITFSATDFATLRTTMNLANFDNGWRGVRLGLVFNQGVISPTGEEHAQFRVVLRGYIGGAWTEVPTTVFHFRVSGLINLNPTLVGAGYTITEEEPTNGFEEPDGQCAHLPGSTVEDIPTYTINSTIYLQRGWNIGNDEFCQFASYMENNIKEVWDSYTNWGLGSTYLSTDVAIDPMISIVGAGQPTGDFSRTHIILSDGIKVKVATAKQFQKLNKGECLFIVTTDARGQRSYVDANRKTGEMFYELTQPDNATTNNASVPYVGLANVPAHEFGHVLGLADYYGYVAEVGDYGASVHDNTNVVNPHRGGTTGVYHIGLDGQSIDPEYAVRYNWVHNLMSSMMNVQNITGSLMRQDGTAKNFTFTKTYQEYYKWYARTLPDNSVNPRITIFVTPTQLTRIIDGDPQDGMLNYVCFRDDWNGSSNAISSAYNNYDGTFTSPTKNINGQIKIYTDEKFRSRHNFSGTYDVLFNRFEHNMDYRIKDNPAGTGNHYENAYTSYFNPFYANPNQATNFADNRNRLAESNIIEPTQFNPLHFVYSPGRNRDFMYDILVGGFAFNTDASDNTRGGLRVCQNRVNDVAGAPNAIYNLLPTASNTLAVPVPDDVPAFFAKRNKAPDIGINARRIFVNALWYVSNHLKAIIDNQLTFAGNIGTGGTIEAFTEYEKLFLPFLQKKLPPDYVIDDTFVVPNVEFPGTAGSNYTTDDKFRNVGEASTQSARNYWNRKKSSDDSNGNGILIEDGNGKYVLMEFEKLAKANPSNFPSGWKRRVGETITYSQNYQFFLNRRTIIHLIRNGILQ